MTATTAPGSLGLVMQTAVREALPLEVAFDRCAEGLYRYFAVRLGSGGQSADDLMQQLWLASVRFGGGLALEELEPWLRSVAKNLVRDHWRRQRRKPPEAAIADPRLAAELSRRMVDEEVPADVLMGRETRDQLLLAVTSLGADEQRLILGRYVREKTLAELAAESGLSERAVEGRLYRARQALRAALERLNE